MSFQRVPRELFLPEEKLKKIEDSLNESIRKLNTDLKERELNQSLTKWKRTNKDEQ